MRMYGSRMSFTDAISSGIIFRTTANASSIDGTSLVHAATRVSSRRAISAARLAFSVASYDVYERSALIAGDTVVRVTFAM